MKVINKVMLFSSALLLIGLGACKKSYLDRLPSDQAPLSDVFKTTDGAEAALQGLHRMMYEIPGGRQDDEFAQKSIDLMNDLMGNDMIIDDAGAGWFTTLYNYTASRTPEAPGTYPWNYYFQIINNANEILSHLDAAVGPQADKDNIKGQTLFYRAFAYYNLSIYYQHTYMWNPDAPCVPIYTEPTREGNARATTEQVYEFINHDLAEARSLLGSDREDKSQINIDVVNGLSARVALVMNNWDDAIAYAQAARQNYPLMDSTQLLSGFNDAGNPEWIWASKLVEDQTSNVQSFISEMDVDAGGYAALGQQKKMNKTIYNLMPNSDVRKQWWYNSQDGLKQKFSQKKFRVKVVGLFGLDQCYMRSAEMYLIEAEAYAHKGDNSSLTQAADILSELVTKRQPDYDVSQFNSTQSSILIEILHQRRIELWGEGFRFSDIQRCATFDETLFPPGMKGLHREGTGASAILAGSAMTFPDPFDNHFLFRIPGAEMQTNDKMVQNP